MVRLMEDRLNPAIFFYISDEAFINPFRSGERRLKDERDFLYIAKWIEAVMQV